jgi:hypothetical protein
MWWRIITDAPLLEDGSRKFLAWTQQGQQGYHVLSNASRLVACGVQCGSMQALQAVGNSQPSAANKCQVVMREQSDVSLRACRQRGGLSTCK